MRDTPFTLEDHDGHKLDGHEVEFTIDGVHGASLHPSSATTGSDGKGTAETTFLPGDAKCGTIATITGTEGTGEKVSAQVQIEIVCKGAGSHSGGTTLSSSPRVLGVSGTCFPDAPAPPAVLR